MTVFSQGSADKDSFRDSISHVNDILKAYGWDLIDSIICGGTTSPNFEISKGLLEQAFQDGKKLIKS
ncbi:MAG: hypothetical protein ABFD18_18520 [Syntrophomonas sp.]